MLQVLIQNPSFVLSSSKGSAQKETNANFLMTCLWRESVKREVFTLMEEMKNLKKVGCYLGTEVEHMLLMWLLSVRCTFAEADFSEMYCDLYIVKWPPTYSTWTLLWAS